MTEPVIINSAVTCCKRLSETMECGLDELPDAMVK